MGMNHRKNVGAPVDAGGQITLALKDRTKRGHSIPLVVSDYHAEGGGTMGLNRAEAAHYHSRHLNLLLENAHIRRWPNQAAVAKLPLQFRLASLGVLAIFCVAGGG